MLPPIAELLPHRAPMILLDEVIGWDGSVLVVAVTIQADTLFRDETGVPAYIGLEYMAQACGAFAGMQAREAGEPVRIGFLLGTRKYEMYRDWFRLGERLTIAATMVYRDEQMGNFAVRIEIDGELAVAAQLTVYQPPGGALLGLGR